MDNPEIIFKYFNDLSPVQKTRFSKLGELYEDWNKKINVISRKDLDHLYERHVLHSLGIGKVIQFKPDTSILDVGTGGGFPGIPLAILFPESRFYLVDSIGKKVKVVDDIVAELRLTNVRTEHVRAENITSRYDFVISRAVTRIRPFYQLVYRCIKDASFNKLQNGILYLKGGDITGEMKELNKSFETYELKNFYEEDFFETKKVIFIPNK